MYDNRIWGQQMRSNLTVAFALLLGLPGSTPVWAHHSFAAEYDTKQLITLKGVITKVEWTNPHISLSIDVKDAKGEVTNWALVGDPPEALIHSGLSRDKLKVGDEITVTAYKAKDGKNIAHGREVIFSDGTKRPLGPPAE